MNKQTIYTNEELRSYLSENYILTFRRNNQDHFYNYLNRKTIAVPLPIIKQLFTHDEVIKILGGKGRYPNHIEIEQLSNHIKNK